MLKLPVSEENAEKKSTLQIKRTLFYSISFVAVSNPYIIPSNRNSFNIFSSELCCSLGPSSLSH